MYVCLCKGITDSQIKDSININGFTRLNQLHKELGICGQCGKCAKETRRIMNECLREQETSMPWPIYALQEASYA